MKIGVVALGNFNIFDGGYTVLYNLLRRLPTLDKENEYFLIVSNKKQFPKDLTKNYKVITIRHIKSTFYQRMTELFLLPFILRKYHIEVYLCPNNYSPLLTKAKVALIFQRRLFNYTNLDTTVAKIYKRILLLCLKRADIIFVASNNHKKDLVKYGKLSPSKIKVAYLGVDLSPPVHCKKIHMLINKNIKNISDTKIGLFVSVLRPYKNLELLIETTYLLKNKFNLNNFKLLVVGSFPRDKYKNFENYEKHIRDLIHKRALDNDIIFLGSIPHDKISCIYERSDIFLFPSKFEGFGLPLVEAMKANLPIIASNRAAIPEVVGDAGILLDPEKPEEWADWIYRILNDNKLRRELIEKATLRVKNFTWDNFTMNIIKEVYKFNTSNF